MVIGGDAAGMSAASTAKRRDPDLDVVAFDKGPYTSFSACGIPFYVSGVVEQSDGLIARSPEEHRKRGLVVHPRTEVLGVDLDTRVATVRDATGSERREGFDRLVLATGAEAVALPVPGAERAEPARTIPEAERLRFALEHGGRSAVVVGGGYIGLEMAEALVERGLSVTLVEQADRVMATLDEDMAAHVQDAAEGVGIDVRLGATLEEIRERTVVVDGEETRRRSRDRGRRACGPRRTSPSTRGCAWATAARSASTTGSDARATRASGRPATASRPGIESCNARSA